MSDIRFTKVEQRILDVLGDGNIHTVTELHVCLEDTLGPIKNVHPHLVAIRNKLRPIGQGISTTMADGIFYYRHVRLIAPVSRQ